MERLGVVQPDSPQFYCSDFLFLILLHFGVVGAVVALLRELHTRAGGTPGYWGDKSAVLEAFALLWDGNMYFY